MQRRDSASGNAGTTGSLATASAFLSRFGRLSGDDVHLHLFDVGDAQGADLPSADQRHDMRLDPAAIHGQRRSLDRPVLATEDRPGFGVLKIPIADFPDRDGRPGLRPLLGRVGTAHDGCQLQDSLFARLVDGKDTIPTDYDPAATPFLVPVLKHERLEARRDDADAKSAQFRIPQERLSLRGDRKRVDRCLGELAHASLSFRAFCLHKPESLAMYA